MHSAVQEGMNANTVGYRAAGATGVPVITFEQPGSRSITMGQAAIPSAPMLQLPALPQGLPEAKARRCSKGLLTAGLKGKVLHPCSQEGGHGEEQLHKHVCPCPPREETHL